MVSYCTARLILVTWSRPNLIIGLIFPIRKKRGQLGKKILLNVLQVYGFPFTKLPTRQTISNTWEKLNTIRHISSYVHRYGYLSTLNYTGIEQVIQPVIVEFYSTRHYTKYYSILSTMYTCRFNR